MAVILFLCTQMNELHSDLRRFEGLHLSEECSCTFPVSIIILGSKHGKLYLLLYLGFTAIL